ncbi:hypothetical protein ES703_108355 [subsurface metagenome]
MMVMGYGLDMLDNLADGGPPLIAGALGQWWGGGFGDTIHQFLYPLPGYRHRGENRHPQALLQFGDVDAYPLVLGIIPYI